jgi:hypothetical protein
MQQENSQLTFSFLAPRKQVTARFDGGQITTEAGLLPLKEFEHKIRYLDRIHQAISDPRQSAKIVHEQYTLLAQRLFGIIAGYEDCNDHQRLRHDPTFKVIAAQTDLTVPLAGQSTLCRLENRIENADVDRLTTLLIDTFLEARRKQEREVVLDLDTSDDPCHGQQQLSLFHAHYDNYIYLPLFIYEGHSGHLLKAALRTGKKPSGAEVVQELAPVVKRLQAAKGRLRLRLRADAEFAAPKLYRYLEAQQIPYAIGIPGFRAFRKQAKKTLQSAQRAFERTRKPQKRFGEFCYRAKSWPRQRRIVFKVEVTARGQNLRFVITNRRAKPKKVFAFYEQRGECENRIKELKCGFLADRLSCHGFRPNCFRLLLHTLAYNLHNRFRRVLKQSTQIDTTRWQLFKLGAYVECTTRRLWFHLSQSWPFVQRFRAVCQAITALPTLAPT